MHRISQALIIIPPATSHHSTNDGEFPLGWFLAYCAIALITWLAAAVILSRSKDHDQTEAFLLGSLAGLVWPLVLLALPMWWAFKRLTAERPTATKTTN